MSTSVMDSYSRGPYMDEGLESDLQTRLSRIEGHVRGIKKMLAEHRDCDDILMQVAGVNAALRQAAIKLLEAHLESCVQDAMGGERGGEAIDRFKASLSRVLK